MQSGRSLMKMERNNGTPDVTGQESEKQPTYFDPLNPVH